MATFNSRTPQLSNLSEHHLSVPVTSTDTVLSLASLSGMSDLVTPFDYIPLVLRDATTYREIVHVTSIDAAAGTVTVLRGQEGTTARTWPTSTFVYTTLTAEAARDLLVNTWRRPLLASMAVARPTRVDDTSFTVPEDQTGIFVTNCALRVFQGGAILTDSIYVVSAIFSQETGLTTVTISGTALAVTPALDAVDVSQRPSESPKHIFVPNEANLRDALGLTVGLNIQAYSEALDAIARLTAAADKVAYYTGHGTAAMTALTQFARALLACADPQSARAALGVQPAGNTLSALSELVPAADQMIYATGANGFAMTAFTAIARLLLSAPDAATMRAVLGAQLADAATAKWNQVGAYTKQQFTPPASVAAAGGAIQLNLDTQPDINSTLTSAVSFLNPTGVALGKSITISVFCTAAQAITWGSAWKKSADVDLPTQSVVNCWHTMFFRCMDGANMTLIGTATTA